MNPSQGERQTLDWLASTSSDLLDIYEFLLYQEVVAEVADIEGITDTDLPRVVSGRADDIGAPLVRVRDGSLILELAQRLDNPAGIQALVWLGIVLKAGPAAAKLPHRIREAWHSSAASAEKARTKRYSSASKAEKARMAYEKLGRRAAVEVIDNGPPEESTASK